MRSGRNGATERIRRRSLCVLPSQTQAVIGRSLNPGPLYLPAPSISQPTGSSLTAPPLCSPPHIFSAIWACAFEFRRGNGGGERLEYYLIIMKAETGQKGEATSSESGAPHVSISKVLAAQRLPRQRKQRARRATCPGSRQIPANSEGRWSRNSCTHQAPVLL